MVGLFDGACLTIDTYYRLSVGFAQMNPAVREVNLKTVGLADMSAIVFREAFLDLLEDGIDIDIGCEVDIVLGNLIVGEGGAQLTGRALMVCQTAEEQGNAY